VEAQSLVELSGVAVSRRNPGILWVHQDADDGPFLFALDVNGVVLTTVYLDGAEAVDWEDIAVGPCPQGLVPAPDTEHCIFVGDIGDNEANRDDTAVLITAEPDLSAEPPPPSLIVPFAHHPFRYPDGPRDAEGLAVTPASVPVVVGKAEGRAEVFGFPDLSPGQEVELTALGVVDVGPGPASLVTAADLWPTMSSLLLRTRGGMFELPLGEGGFSELDRFDVVLAPSAPEQQGEAAAYDPGNRGIWHLSEGVNPGMFFVPCSDD
jgi:hypothetical protein